ncbi:MAG: hypothetical protein JWO80_3269 [Bryobacterales bacterium]|nr:hypothetical protein [Bryobacterales bacterium]
MGKTAQFAWEECGLVERVAGKMNGQPVIKGTRIRPETIVENFEGGRRCHQTTSFPEKEQRRLALRWRNFLRFG